MRTSLTVYKASLAFTVLEKLGIYVMSKGSHMNKVLSNSQELVCFFKKTVWYDDQCLISSFIPLQ